MEMRIVYSETLKELIKNNKEVVVLEADLASASGTKKLYSIFPEKTVNCGISEANMMSAAAGMSLLGLRPYVHTFAPFATRRALDQLYMSVAYSENPIHIYGSDPGFWAQHNGGTHTSYEDIATMTSIPNFVVTAPSDATQFRWVLKEFMNHHKPFYTRAPRKELPKIYNDNKNFNFGKAIKLKDGDNIAVLAVGSMVHEAIKAHEILCDMGIKITVIDVLFLKPIDIGMINDMSENYKGIITIENHSSYGGLSSIVSKILCNKRFNGYFKSISVEDRFGEVGQAEFLKDKHKLNSTEIIKLVMEIEGIEYGNK